MNFQKLFARLCLTAAVLSSSWIFLAAPGARADGRPTINIDFGSTASPLFSGAGADPNDSGVIWNQVAPAPSAHAVTSARLSDSNGNITSSVINISGITAVSTPGGSNPTTNALLVDYLEGQTATVTFNITNLNAFTRYKVYLYGAGNDSGQGSIFSYGGQKAATNGTARGAAFVQGVNYAVLTVFPDEDGVLTLSMASNSATSGMLPVINGLQLQQDIDALATAPSHTDAFDISQGTKILGGSPTLQNRPLEPAIGGIIATNSDPQAVLFRAGDPPGTVDFIEFQMPSVKTIRSISIYAAAPSNPRGAATQITLWAYNAATSAYDIQAFKIYPANPYALTLAPPGAAVQSNSDPSLLAVTANITPVTTDRFRIELVQAESGAAAGLRLNEVDGFTTLSPGLQQPVPIVTTASTTTGQVGTPFSYQLAGSNDPTSFIADGLPAGLQLDAATGAITGTPTLLGTYDVVVSGVNASGNGPNATLRIIITAADENIQGINILSPPSDVTIVQNKPVDLYAAVSATAGTLQTVNFVLTGPSGTTTLATSNVARSQTTWQPTVPGDYTLQVMATDINAQTKQLTQPIHVITSTGTVDAAINVLSGVNNQLFALGSSIQIIASAVAADGTPPSDVRFFLDGQEIPNILIAGSSLDAPIPARRSAGLPRRTAADGSGAGGFFAVGSVPLTKIQQLLTAVVTGSNGVSTVSPAVKIMAKSARTNAVNVKVNNLDGTPLASGNSVPSTVTISVANATNPIAKVEFFADAQVVGSPVTAEPYEFTMPGLTPGQHVLTALATDDANVSSVSDPIVINVPVIPVVSVKATDPSADAQSGEAGIFTVNRVGGNLAKKLKVRYMASGAAVAGEDYQTLSGSVKIKANRDSAQIVINPLQVAGATGSKKVKLKLLPSDTYTIGVPRGGKVKIRQ